LFICTPNLGCARAGLGVEPYDSGNTGAGGRPDARYLAVASLPFEQTSRTLLAADRSVLVRAEYHAVQAWR